MRERRKLNQQKQAIMALGAPRLNPHFAAEKAVAAIGLGYDLCNDIRLTACKSGQPGSRLIELDQTQVRDLLIPGGVVVPHVSTSIKCDKGERTRFRSDVVSFHQVGTRYPPPPPFIFCCFFFLSGFKKQDSC